MEIKPKLKIIHKRMHEGQANAHSVDLSHAFSLSRNGHLEQEVITEHADRRPSLPSCQFQREVTCSPLCSYFPQVATYMDTT